MHGWTHCLLRLYLALFILLPQICGRTINVTIDDQYGDPTNGQVIQYNPPEAWQTGQNCGPCTAKPSPARNAHNGTWMDGTFFPSGTGTNGVSGQIIRASVPFRGTAVYVNVILTGSVTSPDGNSDFTFIIDNATAGVYQQPPNGDPSYSFNQIVFAQTNLSNSLHTITIESGRAGNKSLVLLDSIIYTRVTAAATGSAGGASASETSDSSETGSSPSNIGIIVGPVVGGVIVAGAIIGLAFFLRRRRQGQRIRVLIDSPPMESVSPAPIRNGGHRGPSSDPATSPTHIDPFIAPAPHAPYSHSNQSVGYFASAHDVPIPREFRAELNYDPSSLATPSEANASTQHLGTQPRWSMSRYGEVDESAVDASTPFASPPSYSEVDSSGSSNVSRLPNPYSKGAHT